MDFDFLRPIISGLIGGFVVFLLARAGRKAAPRSRDARVLSYGPGFQIVVVVLVAGAALMTYAAAYARPSQAVLAAGVAGLFVALTAFLAYQAFFVFFAYDDRYIYYRSPLAGSHTIPWSDVEVGFSRPMQSFYLRTPQVGRIWCSNMLRGYEELGEFLSQKIEQAYGMTQVDTSSALWSEAVAKARASTPLLRQLMAAKVGPVAVKYPLTSVNGETEHVWGELLDMDETSFRATLETLLVAGPPKTDGPYRLPLSELEDWLVTMPDGAIRGGYTTRAEIVLARRAGRLVPRHVAAMADRFVDA